MWHQSFSPANCYSFFGLIIILFDIGLPIFGQFYPHQHIGNSGYWDYENGQQQNNAFINSGNQFQQFPSSQSQPMFGQWTPTQQQQFFQPPPPSFPPPKTAHSNSFQLPYASYRGSAFSVPPSNPSGGIDQIQKERLDRIAHESESFGSERARSGFFGGEQQKPQFGNGFGGQGGGADGIQRILASVAEKLPKIAETMARLSGGGKGSDGTSSVPKEKFVVGEFEGEDKQQQGGGISPLRREYEIGENQQQQKREGAQLINSMPEPSSLFSFNKLLSAFGAAAANGGGGQKTNNGVQEVDDGIAVDLKKRTPILKSEDLEPELILQQKSVKEEFSQQQGSKEQQNLGSQQPPHLTPPPELPSQPQNPLNSFLQQFGIPNNFMATTTAKTPSAGPGGVENEESGDLFGALMKGKLPQMPDWLKQFGLDGMFGGNGTAKQGGGGHGGGAEDAGNALAQLFGGGKGGGKGGGGFGLGSVLGSGLDDSPRR